ncbi:MAG: VCBS repeat-containing protein [Flavobacteriaceae bacterium]
MKLKNSPPIHFLGSLILILTGILGCTDALPTTLFTIVPNAHSGLDFNNQLTENDSINILDNEFVYNGAGIAMGDVNGDGYDDLFFAGNQVANKLFLNKGKLKFEDISTAANIAKTDTLMWSSGVSLVDVNADGKLDIYVCNTFRKEPAQRRNLLYINQGNDANGAPTFKEMSQYYGVADDTYSSHAQFFDFDNDGDLDLFIGVNRIEGIDPSEFRPLEDDGTSMSRDKLFENTFNDSLNRQIFVDVSEKAGIRYHGYSHSTVIHDFNEDGWPDIYVANDFLSNDIIYINNHDGTFTNRANDIFKHFSLSSMGSDIADVDNNGRMDIYTTEMQPYYNKRKKLFQGPSSYQKEIFTKKYGYEFQYARNTLQMNMGTNPLTELPIFGEVGMFAGVQETDWSWAPLFADYDNDGWQDLLITNGFPKDVTDRDFGDFRVTASRLVSKEKLISAIPEIKLPNFIFKNNGGLEFSDETQAWGLNFGTFSSGAVYGDLDLDGDLDIVINNINDPALLLENHSDRLAPDQHYLRINLAGSGKNGKAIGSSVEIFANGRTQKKEVLSGRGYLSQPEQVLHFGLGAIDQVDSIKIKWPNGNVQLLGSSTVDTTLILNHDPQLATGKIRPRPIGQSLFKETASARNLDFLVGDYDFIDFNFQRTIPHKFSQYGPSIAVGDINNDGFDDVFVGASRMFKENWFVQRKDGGFDRKEISYKTSAKMEEEDAGSLLFDADNDGDLDLYIARGCGQYPINHEFYTDVLYKNDGKGNFSMVQDALPGITANSSTVKAADFDMDGDLDLFVGSRVLPFAYPMSDRSYILRNESTPGNPKFVDATESVAKELVYAGMISDALWTDFNGDSRPDLVLAGEWMPLRFFKNENGKLVEVTSSTGIADDLGWWNSLAAADIDNDGDMDYVAGNFGKNMYLRGNKEEPVRVYAKDLDGNGTIDPLISYYLRDSIGTKKEYLYHPWQDVTKQYVGIRKRFNSYGAFGESTLPEMFSDGLLNDATQLTFNYMQSAWVENLGNGRFKMHSLPIEAQLAPIYGILPEDIDGDGNTDLLLIGNDYGMEVQQGKADALNGVVLKNKGKGDFYALPLEESRFFVPGDGKSLVSVAMADDNQLIIASQNNDSLKVFEPMVKPLGKMLKLAHNEVKAKIKYANGAETMREFYWGSTFQSQSSRTIFMTGNMKSVAFFDNSGKETRIIGQ